MIIYKFGGASVRNVEGVQNLVSILSQYQEASVVVLSALGKTTNQLEKLTRALYHQNREGFASRLAQIREYHFDLLEGLFPGDDPVYEVIGDIFDALEQSFDAGWSDYDFIYDQVVSQGEILSTQMVSAYIKSRGISCRYEDIRQYLITDRVFREANIDWPATRQAVSDMAMPGNGEVILTQGFIGGTRDGESTTLGREGSDYTAAILANLFDAQQLIIWKDVPGVLNADPRYFENPRKLERISYQEAIELAYFGAKIIHPKTIKPLQNKGIPLQVKSFLEPGEEGTLIGEYKKYDGEKPIFILKEDQVLLSILPRDFSFVVEEQLSKIYGIFARHRTRINIMQNSALSFTVCVNDDYIRIPGLIDDLKKQYRVLYNRGLQLITVRHYNETVLGQIQKGRHVLVEQRSRHTAQFLMES
jgi:aspartate kinase